MNITQYDETQPQQCCCPGREWIPILVQHWGGYSENLGLSKSDGTRMSLLSNSAHPESDGLTQPGTSDVILPDTQSAGHSYFVPEPGPEVPEKQADGHEVVEV